MLVASVACTDDDGGDGRSAATGASTTASSGDDRSTVAASWTERSAAPVPATEVASARFDGRIWVVGGFGGDGRALDLVQVYDPTEDSWSAGPSLPVTVHHAVAVALPDALVVVAGYGGRGFGEPVDSVWTLSSASGDWTAGPPLPSPRGAGAGAWDGARLVFGGGVGPNGLAADVWALSDGEWALVGELSEARDHLGAAGDGDGRVWFMGGRLGSLDANRATVDLVEDGRVRPIGVLPTPRGGVAGFHAPGIGACLAGGEAPETTFDRVECIDADGRSTTLPSLGSARHGLGAAVADGVAYVVLGGPEPGLTASAAVEALPLG